MSKKTTKTAPVAVATKPVVKAAPTKQTKTKPVPAAVVKTEQAKVEKTKPVKAVKPAAPAKTFDHYVKVDVFGITIIQPITSTMEKPTPEEVLKLVAEVWIDCELANAKIMRSDK